METNRSTCDTWKRTYPTFASAWSLIVFPIPVQGRVLLFSSASLDGMNQHSNGGGRRTTQNIGQSAPFRGSKRDSVSKIYLRTPWLKVFQLAVCTVPGIASSPVSCTQDIPCIGSQAPHCGCLAPHTMLAVGERSTYYASQAIAMGLPRRVGLMHSTPTFPSRRQHAPTTPLSKHQDTQLQAHRTVHTLLTR